MEIVDVFLHLDQHVSLWVQNYGAWIYLILFLIVFAETGLVVTPFLPGDSLLFAIGALTVVEGGLSFSVLSVLLVLAAFIGDNVNYRVGRWLGPQVFTSENSKWLNRKHLDKTQAFYLRYGAQMIVIARFMPFVRTFAPFVAGVGAMNFPKYLAYSLGGAILWTQIFLWAGRVFGNLPAVKSNFHFVIFAVIGLSLLPMFIGWFRHRSEAKNQVPTA